MNKANNARVCDLYLEYDIKNIEHAKAQLITKDLLKSHNYSDALEVFLELADQGDPAFQHNAGVLYQCIDEVRDYTSALLWYKKAVAQDFAPAKERLGSMYEFGDGGLPVDLSAAISLYRESADQGNLHSAYNLGMILATGSNCSTKNVPMALPLLLEAARQGHALMKFNLGIVYHTELKNEPMANHWFKQAFDQDSLVSIDLGNYYLDRYHRCHHSKDAALSQYWFAAAIACGYEKWVLDIFDGNREVLSVFKTSGRFH